MNEPSRWSSLTEPLRGAAYILGLGLSIVLVSALVAGLFVRVMT